MVLHHQMIVRDYTSLCIETANVPWTCSSITLCMLSVADDITRLGIVQFDFNAIEAATSNFQKSNKLGQGGFGEVYKV